MSKRKRFEAWMHTQEKSPYLKRLPAGPYADPVVQVKWNTWQAAKADAAEEQKALVARVERLREIEAQAINVARAFATGSGWQKERAFKDLIERLAQHEASKEDSDDQ